MLEIVHYPHPTLRHCSKPVKRVDKALRGLVEEMFELMYEFKGVGLAANQVNLPLRFFVMNLSGVKGEGEERVLINPVVSKAKGAAEGEEGCLSLPGVFGPVTRAKQIHLHAYTLQGEEVKEELKGMEARVVMHEVDHLDGVMFTDRMSAAGKEKMIDSLEEFELAFQNRRRLSEIPDDPTLAKELAEWERKYA